MRIIGFNEFTTDVLVTRVLDDGTKVKAVVIVTEADVWWYGEKVAVVIDNEGQEKS